MSKYKITLLDKRGTRFEEYTFTRKQEALQYFFLACLEPPIRNYRVVCTELLSGKRFVLDRETPKTPIVKSLYSYIRKIWPK